MSSGSAKLGSQTARAIRKLPAPVPIGGWVPAAYSLSAPFNWSSYFLSTSSSASRRTLASLRWRDLARWARRSSWVLGVVAGLSLSHSHVLQGWKP